MSKFVLIFASAAIAAAVASSLQNEEGDGTAKRVPRGFYLTIGGGSGDDGANSRHGGHGRSGGHRARHHHHHHHHHSRHSHHDHHHHGHARNGHYHDDHHADHGLLGHLRHHLDHIKDRHDARLEHMREHIEHIQDHLGNLHEYGPHEHFHRYHRQTFSKIKPADIVVAL